MLRKKVIWGNFIGLGFLLSLGSGVASAQMPAKAADQMSQFRQIEQPLGLKTVVTLGGVALIGLELWWFLLRTTPTSIGPKRSREL